MSKFLAGCIGFTAGVGLTLAVAYFIGKRIEADIIEEARMRQKKAARRGEEMGIRVVVGKGSEVPA